MSMDKPYSPTLPFASVAGLRLRRLGAALAAFLRALAGNPTAMVGLIVIVAYVLAAVCAPLLTPHDPTRGDLALSLLPPSWMPGGDAAYPLGADFQGRDLLARIIYGARISLWIGVLCVSISATVGAALGCIAGYYRGVVDTVLSRVADLLLAFPLLIFAIGVMAFLGPGFANLVAALTFKEWVEFFRLTRGEVISEKTKEYVEAAKVSGQSNLAIIAGEILPNVSHSLLVLAILRVGYVIVYEASLSFIGLGIQPPTPAWGSMISEGRDFLLTQWWLSTLPGLALLVLILCLNLFGEGLRDTLDPRLKTE
jgi:ABC-type dipeptide/oligopeptide/nickel transport system permease subunit